MKFKSIKWKFILIYFLLVFISMVIVTTFIVRNLETYQVTQIKGSMENSIKKLLISSTYLKQSEKLIDSKEGIQKVVREWPIASTEQLYIIDTLDKFKIIADTTSTQIKKKSAFDIKQIREDLVLATKRDLEVKEAIISNYDDDGKSMHMSYPILNNTGEVKGIVYMIKDLSAMYRTIEESQNLLLKATIIALFTTVLLGYFIARSITEPINDLTEKVEKMAVGDFEQSVGVKSSDEIGQLANMFDYLRLELRESISKLTREKNRLDIMFANMADGVMLVDRDGEIIHANQVMTDILQMSYIDLLNSNYNHIMNDLESKLTLDYIVDKELEDVKYIIEINSCIYNLRYGFIRDENDEVDGMIAVFQDITEQQKLDNMRKEFVADVSHELKTPITTIKSYAETLLHGEVDPDSSNMFLSVIDEECDRMSRIVTELLQLSNFDAKRVVWKKEDIDLNELIEKIYMKVHMSAIEKRQNVEIDMERSPIHLFMDRDALEQVLLNIITNAIRYTGEEGKIIIATKTQNESVVICISDNGMGIPSDDLKRIFERFYRVDKARARELGGSGLGLPIAKHIVDAHGGTIDIESKYEVGTRVCITLPIENKISVI